MAGRQRPVYTAYGRSCRVTELWEEEEEEEEKLSDKENIMIYFKPWMNERRTLYCKLDKMADDLHDLHVKSSVAVLLGVAACAGSFLMNLFAEKNKWENVSTVSRAVGLGGGATAFGMGLVQQHQDFVALEAARKDFEGHKATYNALKQKLKEANITDGPELDDSDLRCPKRPEYYDTLAKISSLLVDFYSICKLLPTFFKSWETMNGAVVPETVKRIRHFKEKLQVLEDQLMVDMLSYYSQS